MGNIRDYSIITGAYWVFTITDGALRMLVLLYLHERGLGPMALASVFLLYEFLGAVTNLLGGWLGSRLGLKVTLLGGLAAQILACMLLTVDEALLSVPLVMGVQGVSGVAKDLTKMSAKSYIKLVLPEDATSTLMRWVALLTGSKNTLKGVGFFVGGWLLLSVGFQSACQLMAGVLALGLVGAALALPRAPGRSAALPTVRDLLPGDRRIRWLSISRFFLFGARDIWFVVALPVFLTDALGWTSAEVGGALALWVITYGGFQAMAPRWVGGARTRDDRETKPPGAGRLTWWTAALLAPSLATGAALHLGMAPAPSLAVGLLVFGWVFASDSAIHSFLIVAYADQDKVAMNVGFYYMANAMGRLAGTLISGVLYALGGQGLPGLTLAMVGALLFVALATVTCVPLRRAEAAWDQ